MRDNSTIPWIVLVICVALAFAAFAYPMYVIRPFRAQGERELAAALAVRTWGPPLATAAALIATTLCALSWRVARRASKGWAAGLAAIAIVFAGLSYVNVYERMFHRIDSPQTLPAREAKIDGRRYGACHPGRRAFARLPDTHDGLSPPGE